jgi:hypothetical protein
MTISNGYATRDEFLKYIQGPTALSADTNDDAVIDAIIEAASRHIDNMTGKTFYPSTASTSRYYTACYNDIVYIDVLSTLVSVVTDNDNDGVYETTWSTTDYITMPENSSIISWIETSGYGNYSFPLQTKGVKIIGTWGYTTAPADIKEACLEISMSIYKRRHGENSSADSMVTTDGVVITPKDIPGFAAKIMRNYKRIS